MAVRKLSGQIALQKNHTFLENNKQSVVNYSSPTLAFLSDCGQEVVVKGVVADYTNYLAYFNSRSAKPREGFFDEIYDIGNGLGFILFNLMQTLNPVKVIETGIAAGASSNLILFSMYRSGFGTLTSIDITSKVGELVEENFKANWNIEILPSFQKRKKFLSVLKNHSETEVFLHDSDHSPEWQIFEIDSVLSSLPNIKFILIDDVSDNLKSYIELSLPEWRLVVINEGRKYSGLLSKQKL